jgi:hypothetical protein
MGESGFEDVVFLQSRGYETKVLVILFLIISFVALSLRYISRCVIVKSYGIEEIFIGLAWVKAHQPLLLWQESFGLMAFPVDVTGNWHSQPQTYVFPISNLKQRISVDVRPEVYFENGKHVGTLQQQDYTNALKVCIFLLYSNLM